jgi:hypothetical protein
VKASPAQGLLRVVSMLSVLALTPLGAGAQRSRAPSPNVAAGSRVRLTLSADEARLSGRSLVAGTLLAANSERFIVLRRDGTRADTVPAFTIDNIEVYAGQRDRTKMIIGGTAAGAGASLLVYGVDRATRVARCGRKISCPLLTPLTYAFPVAVGALFGSTFSASRWVAVSRTAVNVGLGHGRSVVIGSAVAFR